MGFDPPSWQSVCEGARPEFLEPDEFEPGMERGGWQHEASSRVERQFREEVLFERMAPRDRALVRSQSGPGGSLALTTAPTSVLTKIPPHLFRVVLLRRLRLPLPLSQHACRCGRPIDPFGHHRAACARTGALGRRGFALESAAARVCREAGGRVTTNVMVRDLDLPVPDATDSRRLEVVVDGLPLFGGSQLAVDTTLVCALHGDGTPHAGAADTDGVVLSRARRRKERTYPELVGPGCRSRLVVLAVEVGGRWSPETRTFVAQLAKSKARQEPRLLQKRVEQAWRIWWGAILACAAAKAVATCLLDLRCAHGSDGHAPLAWEVEADHRHAGLAG